MNKFDKYKTSRFHKFRVALHGVLLAVRNESSFRVHFALTVAVIFCGFLFDVSLIEWAILILCISAVLAAETFNTAIEQLAKAVTQEENELVRITLDLSSGAVLIAATCSALIGSIIFLNQLLEIIR